MTARNHCDVSRERTIENSIVQAQRVNVMVGDNNGVTQNIMRNDRHVQTQRHARHQRMSNLRSKRLQIRAPQAGWFYGTSHLMSTK